LTLEKPRIVFVLPSLKMGGAERVLSSLLNHGDPSVVDWHLVLIHPREEEVFFLEKHVKVHCLNRAQVSRSLLALGLKLRKLQPDIVLSTLTHLNVALGLIKIVLPQNCRLWYREANFLSVNLYNPTESILVRHLARFFYRRADGLLVLGESIKQDLVQNFGVRSDKIKVLPNPFVEALPKIETNPFVQQGPGPHVLVVGRLDPVKQGELALNAFAQWRKKYPEMQLWFCGTGPQQNFLENMATQFNCREQVHFAGFQKHLRPWYEHADLLLHTPQVEGLPNVLIEAIGYGCPIQVLAHSGASLELLEICGLQHRWVEQLDEPLLGRHDMTKASQKLKQYCDIENIASKMLEYFGLKR
jgi:glycosyltransferase involved in cell wall biosynthesis